jgi:NAD(P)-dependent dehydrogenase (short-subunit alcohol dehydrogenase family)
MVTGGSQGIGFGIARGLANAGATVVIANRKAPEGQAAAKTLQKEGLSAVAIAADVTSRSSISAMISAVLGDWGRPDILVNSAGINIRKAAEDITEEDWDYIVDTNLKGLFFCCQLVAKEMMQNKRGKIINISSELAIRGMPAHAAYAATKAGVCQLTRCLALEWARYNINVNAIGPGATSTPLSQPYYEKNPDALKRTSQRIPIGRIAVPSDYIGVALFLASEASNFVTGQTIFVEGGSTI